MKSDEALANAMWEPPEKFKTLITSAIVGRLEAFRHFDEREERERVNADLANRGILRSGMAATALLRALQPGFDRYAQGVVDDLLGRFRELYGTVPSDAGPWIRAKFAEHVTDLAPRLAHTIARGQLENVGTEGLQSREWTEFNGAAFSAKRRLDQELLMTELKAEMAKVERIATASTGPTRADVFISHASEDKEDAALPLAKVLESKGFTVWIDQAQIKVGDDLLSKIDEGLRSCRFGAVILSPHFFQKHWTKLELSGLATLQELRGRKVILPVWHNIDKAGIAEHSLMLASLYGLSTSNGIDTVASEIAAVLQER
jgi:hypothetical protein